MKLSHPVSYSVADHAAKIFKTEAYKKAAAELGKTPEQFQNEVAAELKRVVAEEHAKELADFEQVVGTRALTAAVEKEKAKQAHKAA
jgi:hypothetical protein